MQIHLFTGPRSAVSVGPVGGVFVALLTAIAGLVLALVVAATYIAIAIVAVAGGAYMHIHDRSAPRRSLAGYVVALWRGLRSRFRL